MDRTSTVNTANLSESQKACLRLVARGMTSKEVALQTGLSPQTVDTYLKSASSRLGVTNRREAARLLAAWEASQDLGSPSRTIDPPPALPETDRQTGGSRGLRALGLPPVGGAFHDLSWHQKSFLAMRVALVGVAVFIALALAIAGLFWTFS